MHFLAGTWWIWLIVWVVILPISIIIFFTRTRRTMESDDFFDKGFLSIFSGMIMIIVAWFISGVSFVLFIIGVIAALVGK